MVFTVDYQEWYLDFSSSSSEYRWVHQYIPCQMQITIQYVLFQVCKIIWMLGPYGLRGLTEHMKKPALVLYVKRSLFFPSLTLNGVNGCECWVSRRLAAVWMSLLLFIKDIFIRLMTWRYSSTPAKMLFDHMYHTLDHKICRCLNVSAPIHQSQHIGPFMF